MRVQEPSNAGLTERATTRSIHAEPMRHSERFAFVKAPIAAVFESAGYIWERIMTNEQETDRSRSRAKWVFIGFMAIAFYFVLSEHRAHLSGMLEYLPLLLLLACPLMHIFMHGHHGRHRHSERHTDEDSSSKEKS